MSRTARQSSSPTRLHSLRREWDALFECSYQDAHDEAKPRDGLAAVGAAQPRQRSGNDIDGLSRRRAYNEHRTYQRLPLWCSLDVVQREIGLSMRWYITFGNWLSGTCALLMCFASVWYGFHLWMLTHDAHQSLYDIVTRTSNPYLWLSTVYMNPRLNMGWWLMLVGIVVTCLGYTWAYAAWVKWQMQRMNANNARRFDATTIDDINRGRIARGAARPMRARQAIDVIQQKDSMWLALRRALHENYPAWFGAPGVAAAAVGGEVEEEALSHGPSVVRVDEVDDGDDGDDVEQATTRTTEQQLNPPIATSVALDQNTSAAPQVLVVEPQTGVVQVVVTNNHVDALPTIDIVAEERRQYWRRVRGWTESIIATSLLLALYVGLNFYFYVENDQFDNQLGLSASLSVMLSIANGLGQYALQWATDREMHQYRSKHHKSFLIKMYVFRMVTTIIMLCFSQLTVVQVGGQDVRNRSGASFDPPSGGGLPPTTCGLARLAEQYAMTVLTEFVTAPVPLLFAWIQQLITRTGSYRRSSNSDNAMRPDFNYAEEYCDLLYKLFLVYVGMPLLPVMAAGMLVVVVCEVQLWDRAKVKYFVRTVHDIDGSFIGLLPWLNLLNIVLGTIVVPNGLIFIALAQMNQCSFVV